MLFSKKSPPNLAELSLQPDDVRPVREISFSKVVMSIRHISGGMATLLFVVPFVLAIGGVGFDPAIGSVLSTSMLISVAVVVVSCFLLQVSTSGYAEKDYEPLESTSGSLERYRRKSQDTIETSGFKRVGVYRIRGSVFSSEAEVFLGCGNMVVCEFVSMSGTKAIELTSMTEDGVCVSTTSVKAPESMDSHQFTEMFVATLAGDSSLERLLKVHLQRVAEIAETRDQMLIVFEPSDATDVLRYTTRAHHHMLVVQGKVSKGVGPMTYGRLRFPDGLQHKNSPVRAAS
ncbi:MAG: hypothetical protein WBD31_03635 [Rubripirellula sp.]